MTWKTKTLAELCKMYQPQTLSKKQLKPEGKYFVYGANGIIGKYNKYNHEETQLLVTCRGATCGAINISEPFSWINGNAMVIQPNEKEVSKKYIEYIFKGVIKFSKIITGSAQPQITRESLNPVLISYPPLLEQQRIVAKLDIALAEIDNSLESLKKNTRNIKCLYDMALSSLFETLRVKFKTVPIADCCDDIFAGGDAPKVALSKTITKKYTVPIYANARKQKGLYGFTDKPRVHVPAITVAGRGSGTGYTEIRVEPFFPIVRLIVLLPNLKKISIEYLKNVIISLNLKSVGSAIPQLTIPMIKGYKIPIPTLNEQANVINKLDTIEIKSLQLSSIYSKKMSYYQALKSAILERELKKEAT